MCTVTSVYDVCKSRLYCSTKRMIPLFTTLQYSSRPSNLIIVAHCSHYRKLTICETVPQNEFKRVNSYFARIMNDL